MALRIQTIEAQVFLIYKVACGRGFIQFNDVRTAVRTAVQKHVISRVS